MKKLDIKKVPKMTIILYSCAALMTLCTIFVIYKSNSYISNLVAQGFNPSNEIVEVVNYYLTSLTPYVFYTISLFSLGYIVKQIDCIMKNQKITLVNNECLDKESKYEDDDIDDLFSNI